jgi:pyruvate dehydrogenase E1 component alpha subunit
MDADGRLRAPLPEPFVDARALTSMYEEMLALRLFDAKAVALQRTGRLGTYPSCLGQEATAVALGRTMAREDVLLGTYRETGTMLARGVRMSEILLYWSGDERGSAYSGPDAPKEDFPICVPIATHAPHAVGVAYAMKLKREPRVAVCVLGDGATSKGDFYEALNGAGVWQLPLVFVVVNNEWAISVPRSAQTRAQTLAQKAIAAGIPGEQVDGNDLIAVHSVLQRAMEKARDGGGPHVVEALTYRLHDHTTADDATRYRTAEDVERAKRLDPLARLRQYLVRERLWTEAQETATREACNARVEQAVAEFLAVPPRAPESMFEHLFAELPAALHEQRDAVRGADHE